MKTHLKNKHRALILKALGPESPYGIEPQFVKSDGALMRLAADVLTDLRERVKELVRLVEGVSKALGRTRAPHSFDLGDAGDLIGDVTMLRQDRDDLRAADAEIRPAMIELARALGLDPETTCQVEMLKRARDAVTSKAPAPQQWPPPVGTRVRWREDGDEGKIAQVDGEDWLVLFTSGDRVWLRGVCSDLAEILS